jgi:hypothetical protein
MITCFWRRSGALIDGRQQSGDIHGNFRTDY